ncbi:MarR family transcriptional regulator [Aeromicrobium sp.]|nr:MarR family transcriptional regulator [Candidatus Saccharibacteria bacterium]
MSNPTYLSGMLFTKAHRLVRGRVYDILDTYDLNPTLWSLLSIVSKAVDGVRSSVVAEQLGVKPPMITMLADQLVEQGLLSRVLHHTDGRVRILVANAKGKKLVSEIETKLNAEIGILLEGLSHDEISTFQKTLTTIIDNAK